MKNVMVCVTQQKNCERLIKYGHDFLGNDEGELFIIHVAHYEFKFLGISKESDALEYLYEKALDYGANLTVVRSNSIIDTLSDLVEKNDITHIVMGASGETQHESQNGSIVDMLRQKTKEKAEVLIIPA